MTRVVWIACALALLPLGCKASSGGSAKDVRTEIDPSAASHTVNSVGILTVATDIDEAENMGRYVAMALSERGYPRYSSVEGFAAEAGRVGQTEAYAGLVKTFRLKGIMEPAPVRRLLGATGHDGLLGIEVTSWEEVQIDRSVEGTSDTSVGLRLVLYGKDGTRLWSGHKLLTEHSIPWDPAAQLATRDSQVGSSSTSSERLPAPPDIEKVALEVARDVVASFPDLKKSGSDAGS